jgi:sulfate transport system ATP-binding protein
LYEDPSNEFVMGFVGPVNRIGETYIRPHDFELQLHPNGNECTEAMVERLVHLGFEVRVELVCGDGEQLSVQISRDDASQLELERGQIVYVRTLRERTFVAD